LIFSNSACSSVTIDAGCQAFDAMDVKIQLDKTKCGESAKRGSSVMAKRVASFESEIDSSPLLIVPAGRS
jgi:hypothetical protein